MNVLGFFLGVLITLDGFGNLLYFYFSNKCNNKLFQVGRFSRGILGIGVMFLGVV